MRREIARDLLKIGAFIFAPHHPFTWASGIKSPVYCDNRLTLSYPEIRAKICQAFLALMAEHFNRGKLIAGVATGGIPYASLIAHELKLPMVYIRSKQKDHGKGNQVEGGLVKGQKVVVIEDLISTGGSSYQAVEAIRQAGGEVLGLMAIFSYGFKKSRQTFGKLPFFTLTDFDVLKEVALEQGLLKEDELEIIDSWRESYV